MIIIYAFHLHSNGQWGTDLASRFSAVFLVSTTWWDNSWQNYFNRNWGRNKFSIFFRELAVPPATMAATWSISSVLPVGLPLITLANVVLIGCPGIWACCADASNPFLLKEFRICLKMIPSSIIKPLEPVKAPFPSLDGGIILNSFQSSGQIPLSKHLLKMWLIGLEISLALKHPLLL